MGEPERTATLVLGLPAAPRLAGPAVTALSAENVVDAKAAIEATYRRSDVAGVCVADGFGVKVTVNRGALEVHDGIGTYRRTRRYDRATHGLRRLVLVQPEGFATFEALRWCGASAWACWYSAPRACPRWRATRE